MLPDGTDGGSQDISFYTQAINGVFAYCSHHFGSLFCFCFPILAFFIYLIVSKIPPSVRSVSYRIVVRSKQSL
jgi:hypothetical protein